MKRGVSTGTATLSLLPTLFPTDLLGGLKMNINRPFGNGQDDSGNVTNPMVDGPSETAANQSTSLTLSGVTAGTLSFDGTSGTTNARAPPRRWRPVSLRPGISTC